ncbi:MAG: LytR/AlgR family response regulator transcription factor [Bacteroidia bacterium]
MNKVTCIIVDDERNNRDVLSKMLLKFCPSVTVLGEAANVKEAVQVIEEKQPDVVFLDIELPDGNGFDILEHFKKLNFFVIFTTAHADYALKAMKFAALDYLLKPLNVTELREAVSRVSEKMMEKEVHLGEISQRMEVLDANKDKSGQKFDFKKIALPSSEGLEFFSVADILKCEADRAYCNFYLSNGKKITVSKPLAEYDDLLAGCGFFRIHKSNTVNLSHIKKYIKGNGGYVILSDGSSVDVSARRKEEFLKVFKTQEA